MVRPDKLEASKNDEFRITNEEFCIQKTRNCVLKMIRMSQNDLREVTALLFR